MGSTLHLTELGIGSEPPPRSVGIGRRSRNRRRSSSKPLDDRFAKRAGAPEGEDRVRGACIATTSGADLGKGGASFAVRAVQVGVQAVESTHRQWSERIPMDGILRLPTLRYGRGSTRLVGFS
jgi:hypothetical protein